MLRLSATLSAPSFYLSTGNTGALIRPVECAFIWTATYLVIYCHKSHFRLSLFLHACERGVLFECPERELALVPPRLMRRLGTELFAFVFPTGMDKLLRDVLTINILSMRWNLVLLIYQGRTIRRKPFA